MLDEPYRWVEAIRNRREYVEDQLKAASAVVGACYDNGILLLTTSPGPRKLFEIYNQVAFAAIGHPADIEKLRKAVIDIAHVEAYNLSASDVQLQRLVNFGLGPLMKTAFDEIFRSPFIARVMVAELDPNDERERFYTIDADGSFASVADAALVAGTPQSAEAIAAVQQKYNDETPPQLDVALQRAMEAWAAGRLQSEREEVDEAGFGDDEIERCIQETLGHQRVEAAILEGGLETKSKFRLVSPEELEAAMGRYVNH